MQTTIFENNDLYFDLSFALGKWKPKLQRPPLLS